MRAARVLVVLVALAAVPAAGAHHLPGRWWEGLTLEERLEGHLHLRRTARWSLAALDAPVALRRPVLTRRSERRHRHMLAVLRREIPETVEALEEAEAVAQAAPDQVASVSSSAFDDGTYNCGLQFADGWLEVYEIRCGDPGSQIAAAEAIAQASRGDPWPNCPDPYDGSGASWEDTVACENGGRW